MKVGEEPLTAEDSAASTLARCSPPAATAICDQQEDPMSPAPMCTAYEIHDPSLAITVENVCDSAGDLWMPSGSCSQEDLVGVCILPMPYAGGTRQYVHIYEGSEVDATRCMSEPGGVWCSP